MSDTAPVCTFDANTVTIRLPEARRGLLARLTGPSRQAASFINLPEAQRDLLFAIGDLRAWADTHPGAVSVTADAITMTHDAAASLSAAAAGALGLPTNVHLVLRTDVAGTVGRPDFRLAYEWSEHGRKVMPRRTGAFLHTAQGTRRLPLWMKRALDLADGFDASRPIDDHWRVLADFRRALEPEDMADEDMSGSQGVANLAMTAFLRGLEVRIADQFSITPDGTLGQFEVVPYSARTLAEKGVRADVSEADAELQGEALAAFQYRLRARGARPAYQLGHNSYLVIDKASMPVLEEISRIQKAERTERKAFIDNPRAFIVEAVTRHLEAHGELVDLDPAGQEELVEAMAGDTFLESREYAERVRGTTVYVRSGTYSEGGGTAWLPEVFSPAVSQLIADMPTGELEKLREEMGAAAATDPPGEVRVGEELVAVTRDRIAAVDAFLSSRVASFLENTPLDPMNADPEGQVILDATENIEELAWAAKITPRSAMAERTVPEVIVTPLRPHQVQCFDWAVDAWTAGLPGILNADEQGLGKTLQTIAFLNWLQANMAIGPDNRRGPVLVVAPTSLLRNWEEEVERHVAPRKFGTLVRLYGSSLSGHKRRGARGTETDSGLPLLDLEWLDEAFEDGRAHRYWVLTTYSTLSNYQHSLGRVRFAALVMDEIQNIKNRDTVASKACAAMNAEFRIGLTGTPIENSTMDLWTIMDRLAPGALGSAVEFRERYGTPDAANMVDLHSRVFRQQGGRPAFGLRRLKDEVATDLPTKMRLLHPRPMPDLQARSYEEARGKLATGGTLRMLHHIRSVSVHPLLHEVVPPERFISQSARLSAVMDVLREIADRRERALVFIEHREMQFRFAELVGHVFGLNSVDVINGDTPIPRRQAIVNRFQEHLRRDPVFDLLILGPKAAGTGLTLTAASHVVHLSRWWNPAVEEQCNDRVHRIGQTRPVMVHIPMAIHPSYREHSFDCLLQSLMQRKRRMAAQALWPMGDTADDMQSIYAGLDAGSNELRGADPVNSAIQAMFARDGMPSVSADARGAYALR